MPGVVASNRGHVTRMLKDVLKIWQGESIHLKLKIIYTTSGLHSDCEHISGIPKGGKFFVRHLPLRAAHAGNRCTDYGLLDPPVTSPTNAKPTRIARERQPRLGFV